MGWFKSSIARYPAWRWGGGVRGYQVRSLPTFQKNSEIQSRTPSLDWKASSQENPVPPSSQPWTISWTVDPAWQVLSSPLTGKRVDWGMDIPEHQGCKQSVQVSTGRWSVRLVAWQQSTKTGLPSLSRDTRGQLFRFPDNTNSRQSKPKFISRLTDSPSLKSNRTR